MRGIAGSRTFFGVIDKEERTDGGRWKTWDCSGSTRIFPAFSRMTRSCLGAGRVLSILRLWIRIVDGAGEAVGLVHLFPFIHYWMISQTIITT